MAAPVCGGGGMDERAAHPQPSRVEAWEDEIRACKPVCSFDIRIPAGMITSWSDVSLPVNMVMYDKPGKSGDACMIRHTLFHEIRSGEDIDVVFRAGLSDASVEKLIQAARSKPYELIESDCCMAFYADSAMQEHIKECKREKGYDVEFYIDVYCAVRIDDAHASLAPFVVAHSSPTDGYAFPFEKFPRIPLADLSPPPTPLDRASADAPNAVTNAAKK